MSASPPRTTSAEATNSRRREFTTAWASSFISGAASARVPAVPSPAASADGGNWTALVALPADDDDDPPPLVDLTALRSRARSELGPAASHRPLRRPDVSAVALRAMPGSDADPRAGLAAALWIPRWLRRTPREARVFLGLLAIVPNPDAITLRFNPNFRRRGSGVLRYAAYHTATTLGRFRVLHDAYLRTLRGLELHHCPSWSMDLDHGLRFGCVDSPELGSAVVASPRFASHRFAPLRLSPNLPGQVWAVDLRAPGPGLDVD
jgi:hypothetical protein